MTSVALAAALWLPAGALGCSCASSSEERAAAPGQSAGDQVEPRAGEAGEGELGVAATVEQEQEMPAEESQAELVEPEPPPRLPADFLAFDGACLPGDRVRLAFAGDLLLHHELQIQAYADKRGAQVLWENIADLLDQPDLTYLNLEGPLAHGLDRDFLEVPDPGRTFDKLVYTSYPRFNYHASIAKDLRAAGVDIVSTANNHALDRGPVGVVHTIEALRKAKLAHVGTRESDALERLYTVTEVGGLRLGWIACTNNTNRVPDDLDQVLQCGRGSAVEGVIERLLATGRKRKPKPKVDAVIVTPHWGKEYVHTPREREQKLAQRWVEAGALAVIGSHPHVVQPWTKLQAEDGREALVMYSLGNFASHQPELSRRSSLLLYLDLVVDQAAEPSNTDTDADPEEQERARVRIAGVRYVPLHVRQDGDRFFVEAIDRVGQPADARALMVALLGPGNLALPDEDKRGDPQCDPQWHPHPIPSWAELDEPFVIPGTEPEPEPG